MNCTRDAPVGGGRAAVAAAAGARQMSMSRVGRLLTLARADLLRRLSVATRLSREAREVIRHAYADGYYRHFNII